MKMKTWLLRGMDEEVLVWLEGRLKSEASGRVQIQPGHERREMGE